MGRLQQIRSASRWRDLSEGQAQHLILLVFLLAGAAWFLDTAGPGKAFLGLAPHAWAWVSIGLAVVHQVVVALVFRLELHRGTMTALFGGRALRVWGVVFFPLLLARPFSLLAVGIADAGSLGWPAWLRIAFGLALLAPAAWTMQVVATRFGFSRALGGDHFRDEFHDMPMVRDGPFAISPNAMYAFGFLGLWAIAVLCGSTLALIVAGFQQAYIWVHMYTVEGPDMARIFGPRKA